jgi:hypothetical protein
MKQIQPPRTIATLKKISLLPCRRHAALLVPLGFLAIAPGCWGDELTCEETKTCPPEPAAGAAGEAGAGGATLHVRAGGAAGSAGSQAGATGGSAQGGAPGDAGSESDDEATGGRQHGDTGGTSGAGPEEGGSTGEGGAAEAGGAGRAGSSAQGGAQSGAGSGGDSPGASGSANAGQAGTPASACTLNDVRCHPETGIPQLCSDERTWEDQPRCQYVCVDGFCTGECSPGKRRCDTGTGIPQLCNEAGEWTNQGACGKGAACAAGECACTSAEMTECDGACVDLDTSPDDCGACGHGCLGGECLEGRCQPVQVAEMPNLVGSIALDSEYVYWMDLDSVWRVSKTGGSVQLLDHDVIGVAAQGGLAVYDGHVYWGRSIEGGSIIRADVDGSNVQAFMGKTGGVHTVLAVDDMLYWNEDIPEVGTTVFSMPIAGAAAPDTVVSGVETFWQFTMAGGCLYYATSNTLMRSCGGSPQPVYTGAESVYLTPYGSSDDTYLYFGSDGEGVMRLLLEDASSPDRLAQSAKIKSAIVYNDTVYYIDGDPPDVPACTSYWGIYSIPKTGGTPTELVGPPTQCPRNLAADAEALYWANTDDGLLMRLAK